MPGGAGGEAGSRVGELAGPYWLRLVALVVILVGGLLAGGGLRLLESELHPGFARLYTAGWILRSGAPAAELYDAASFARRVDAIAGTGQMLAFSPRGPLAAVVAIPFTALHLPTAAFLFGAVNLLALLAALMITAGSLARSAQSDWLLWAGLTLASSWLGRALVAGEPFGLSALLLTILLRRGGRDPGWGSAVVFALLAQLNPVTLLLPLVWFRRGGRLAALRTVAVALLVAGGMVVVLGSKLPGAWFAAWLELLPRPELTDGSIVAWASRFTAAPVASLVAVLLGLGAAAVFGALRASAPTAVLLAALAAPMLDSTTLLLVLLASWELIAAPSFLEGARGRRAGGGTWAVRFALLTLLAAPWWRGPSGAVGASVAAGLGLVAAVVLGLGVDRRNANGRPQLRAPVLARRNNPSP
ncbi:MAG: hypothetical protein IPK72_11250 [Candidatus Eisenbacteria bacterium]|nr:hypothetical protein [Candidatus Eisenbacteria bacterium]